MQDMVKGREKRHGGIRVIFFIFFIFMGHGLFSQTETKESTKTRGNESADSGNFSTLVSGTGGVFGSLIDENGAPLPYASVFLHQLPDSTTITMNITGENGRFAIRDIPYGNYYLEIQCMGYARHFSNRFTLDEKNNTFRVNKCKITQQAKTLATFEVAAQKEMLQSNLDKKVYQVEGNVMAEGATAIEVLQDIPSVEVDIEGNVSLRGNSNVTILVDGRPTNLTLDQIPSSQIESIEVITNPSARLDPDGMSGILNVILKKKKEAGLNGMITLGGATTVFQKKPYFDNYNGNINLNYSYDKINVFLNYSYRRFGRRGEGILTRTSWTEQGDSSFLDQNSTQKNFGNSHNLRTGLDWYVNKQNTLSFTFGYNFNSFEGDNQLLSNNAHLLYGEKLPYWNYTQTGTNTNAGNNYSGNISYKKTFETKGRELTADIYYTRMNRDADNRYLQTFSVPEEANDYFQQTRSISQNQNASAQIDFVTPAGNGGRIETGYKFAYRSIEQDYKLYDGISFDTRVLDSSQINDFLYSEYINSLYFIYSNVFWKKLKVQVGVRGEWANTVSNLKSADTIIPHSYPNIFPSAHVVYEFNEQHSLQISYSMRVTRPRVNQLNPFKDISDRLNISQGNPDLKPEFAHNIELGYLMFVKNTSLSLTTFYRQRNDIISRYTELLEDIDETGTAYPYTLTSYANLRHSQNVGIEAIFGQRIFKWWRLNLNGDFYRVMINSNDLIDENLSNDWSWGFRVNNSFNFPKDWSAQLNFRYRSASLTTGSMGWGTGGVGQGKRSANYSVGLGAKKGFLNNTLTLNLNIRDLIYRRDTKIHTYAYNTPNGYDANSTRQNSQFQVNLSVSYKINNFKRRIDKHPDSNAEEENMGTSTD
ncbi:MAG: TonB-dependent receptor [Bacteroidales bacterium]|jgi:outer membrane receptor protein involved in Fe transport|nr:TonB-dependent receptor [Bacteroidales bacterium]